MMADKPVWADAYRQRTASEWIGLAGAALLALGLGAGGGLVRIGLSLMFIACLSEWRRFWTVIRCEPMAWVALIFSGYLALSFVSHLAFPGTEAKADPDGLKATLVHAGGLAILVGWSLRGERRIVLVMLGLALVGLLFALFRHSSPLAVQAYLAGERASFGVGGNGPGVYFGTAMLGVLTLGAFALNKMRRGYPLVVGIAMYLLTLVLVTSPVVFNQSRSAWLGLLVVLPILITLMVVSHMRTPTRIPRLTTAAVLLALAAMAAVAFVLKEVVTERLQAEQEVIADMAEGNAVAPTSSVAYRANLWNAAHDAILERPMLGHGPGSAEGIIDAYPALAFLPHFHNLYLQILVETGLLGLAGAALIYALLFRALYMGWRGALVGDDLALFLGSAWLFFLLISFFQIRHDDIRGVAYLSILMGTSYTFWLHRKRESPSTSSIWS